MTAPPLSLMRDPFEAAPTKPAEAKTAVEQPQPKTPTVTPTAAGLTLTSTIIGPQRRIAQINGKTYSVGQVVVVSGKEKQSPSVHFRVLEVEPRLAVLEADGQRFELSIPEPAQSAKMEITKQ